MMKLQCAITHEQGVYDSGRRRVRSRHEAVHQRGSAESPVREARDHDALRATHFVQGIVKLDGQ